jgi:PleD family two-component response regulator
MSRKIIAVVDDLFFKSKIRGTAEQAGVEIGFTRSLESSLEVVKRDQPKLVIVDLHSEKIDPLELGRQLKADAKTRAIPILGFFSHVQTELMKQATEAGFDTVIPRSAFSNNLFEILKKD